MPTAVNEHSFEVITSECLSYFASEDKRSPMSIVKAVMDDNNFPMHNYAHHYLVPAVLLAAVCRVDGTSREQLAKYLTEAEHRAKNVLPAFCGLYGACGAAIGCGIFFSVYTGTTPLTEKTWGLCNAATAKALTKMAEMGGPRCCKRNTYIALGTMKEYIRENLAVEIDIPDVIKCAYSSFNNECLKDKCPYHDKAGA